MTLAFWSRAICPPHRRISCSLTFHQQQKPELIVLTVVLEKTLESPFDCKEIQPVHPKGDESWVFTGRTDVEGETPILWPPDVKNWLTAKDPDVGQIQGWKKRGRQRMRWLDGITKSMDMSLTSSKSWWWTGKPGMLQSLGSQRVGHDWVTELNSLEGYHALIRKLQQLTNILTRVQHMASSQNSNQTLGLVPSCSFSDCKVSRTNILGTEYMKFLVYQTKKIPII